jgi:hypothetical protein
MGKMQARRQRRGQGKPSLTKQNQAKLLGIAWFIRRNRDFSMGCGEKT